MQIGKPDDETGTCSIYGRVKITDADLMDRRAEALARSVCGDDPRTHGERRTRALGIIAVNGDRLSCRLGKPDCPAAGKDPRAEHLVIHIITNDPGEDHDDDNGPDDSGPDNSGPDGAGPDGPRRCWSRRRVPTTALDPTVPTTALDPTVPTTALDPTVPKQRRWCRRS